MGSTDLPLSEKGIQGVRQCAQTECYPWTDKVYVSPLLRARETASILFPEAEQVVVSDFREMDFGDFEGHHHSELKDDPAYVEWVNAKCRTACPHGEGGADFDARVQAALDTLIADALKEGAERLVIVAHGGVAMTIMGHWALPKQPFYLWWVPNSGGFRIQINQSSWEKGEFASWEAIGRESWHNRAHSFFQNSECEFFPCHETDSLENFNCLFCFCPLYHLGTACGGTPTFTDKGIKDCSNCTLPHRRDSYGFITDRLSCHSPA